jgi:hypothetical protein
MDFNTEAINWDIELQKLILLRMKNIPVYDKHKKVTIIA